MSELTRRLVGRVVVVTLLRLETTPIKGTLTAIDDKFLVLEHVKGTKLETLVIPITAVMLITEHPE